jgi:hypothetical protein
MAALDPVLVDSYVCYLLHYKPEEVAYVKMAEELGVGSADLSAAEIVSLNAGDGMDDELPHERKLLEVSYAVDEVDSCGACYGNLIPALFSLKEEGVLKDFRGKIGIGQGQQGRKGRIGIGKCTRDFDFCVMGCPPDEEKIYEEIKKYIIENKRSCE